MPIYKFKGYDKESNLIKDQLKCRDEIELKTKLKELDISLLSFKQISEKRKSNFFAVSSKVSKQEFSAFCEEFSIMLKMGTNLNDCLETLRTQNFGTIFKNAISDVYEDVLKGSLLSDAFRKHKKIFPDFFCSMVYIGEISGKLDETLIKASAYYENDNKVKQKVKSAMAYPTFLFVIVFLIFIFLMTTIVPTFKTTLEQYGQELPAITKFTVSVSDFIVTNWLYLLIGLGVFILLIFLFFRTKRGKYIKEAILLHLPVIKKVRMDSLTTRFSTSLSILLEAGLTVPDALKEMSNVINNEYFNKKFQYTIDEVNNGKRLSRALDDINLFPRLLIQMTKVGEDNSSLSESLNKIGRYFQVSLETSIARATALLEPLVIVFMGIVVGFILLSVMLPILQMSTAPAV